mgnify:CR=1 FL=1
MPPFPPPATLAFDRLRRHSREQPLRLESLPEGNAVGPQLARRGAAYVSVGSVERILGLVGLRGVARQRRPLR